MSIATDLDSMMEISVVDGGEDGQEFSIAWTLTKEYLEATRQSANAAAIGRQMGLESLRFDLEELFQIQPGDPRTLYITELNPEDTFKEDLAANLAGHFEPSPYSSGDEIRTVIKFKVKCE